MSEFLFEISPTRLKILEKIDKTFAKLKKKPSDTRAKKALSDQIREFTGIPFVIVHIKTDNYYNASVLPIYKDLFPKDLKVTSAKRVSDIKDIQDASKYIQKIFIIFGDELIRKNSERQLTAILLHELGHVYSHTSNFPTLLRGVLSIVKKGVNLASRLSLFAWLLGGVSGLHYVILILVTTSRSLTFFDHVGEYDADKFAAKFGYGDELIKSLYRERKEQSKEVLIQKIFRSLLEFLTPPSHPSQKNRICSIADEIVDNYKKDYPNLKKELNIMLKDLECPIL